MRLRSMTTSLHRSVLRPASTGVGLINARMDGFRPMCAATVLIRNWGFHLRANDAVLVALRTQNHG